MAARLSFGSRLWLAVAVAAASALVISSVLSGPAEGRNGPRGPESVRFATFNASLNRNVAGEALADLSSLGNDQAAAVAEIIQRTRPDVLAINEFDYVDGPVAGNAMTDAFQENYLGVGQNGAEPIHYPHVFVAPSNTGIQSGRDLDKDGSVGGPGDAFGFGFFPGQFGMAVFSMYPIAYDQVRTFQLFLWNDMPGANLPHWPDDPEFGDLAGEPFYDEGDLAIFRLSSKSHWDIPVVIGGTPVHFLVSHPTPPVFDGPEKRNLWRNNDEIRLWADYITPGPASSYIYDDAGVHGGLKPGSKFVIAGDQNADPHDGDSAPGAIWQLLDHPRVNTSLTPASDGGQWAAEAQGGVNEQHVGDPRHDTADFRDSGPGAAGNLRADYVLPSRELRMLDGGIFWPTPDDDFFYLTGTGFPVISSDHRLVWVDVGVPGAQRGR